MNTIWPFIRLRGIYILKRGRPAMHIAHFNLKCSIMKKINIIPITRPRFRICLTTATDLVSSCIQSNSTSMYVRTQVLTPQCPHLYYLTQLHTKLLIFLLHVLIYLQFRSGWLCNHTRYPGATKTYLNVL